MKTLRRIVRGHRHQPIKTGYVVVVPKGQYVKLTGPDRADEVPSALRELALKRRAAHSA